ncbi:unnamed protein product, partial [Mesorhabditis spiculigera]
MLETQVPLEWALPLYGYLMPLVVALTVATNSFIVVVLSHKYLRTPTNFVLLAMAVSELLTGVCCIPWFLYYYTFGGYHTDAESGLPSIWCQLIPFMASFFPSIFHATAIYLTVYLAIQRYVYICIPTLVRRFCTIKYSKKVLIFIWIFSTLIYAPEALANYHQSKVVKNIFTGQISRQCYRTQSGFLLWIGPNLYYKVFYTIQTVLVHSGPCLLLVIFTWKLVSAIREADKRHLHLMKKVPNHRKQDDEVSIDCGSMTISVGNMSSGNEKRRDYSSFRSTLATDSLVRKMSKIYKKNSNEPKRVQGLKQNTRMLVVVILLFLVTEIPAAMIFTVHVLSVSFRLGHTNYQMLNTSLIIRNVLIVISYPFRFAIYCGMSQQFREVPWKRVASTRLEDRRPRPATMACCTPSSGMWHIHFLNTALATVSTPQSTNHTKTSPHCLRSFALSANNSDACLVIRGTKDTGVQCSMDSRLVFDPLFDDMQHLVDSDSEDSHPIHDSKKSTRGTQCSAKIDKNMFVRRKSSLVATALIDVTTGCHVPVVISIAT